MQNFDHLLEKEIDRIKKSHINANSKDAVLKSVNIWKARGLTSMRILRILYALCTFTKHYKGDITKLRKDKLILCMASLNDANYKPHTIDTIQAIIKEYYNHCGNHKQKDLIAEVIQRKKPKNTYKPSDLLTHKEFVLLINQAHNRVERALYEILRFTGFRIGEALSIKAKSVKQVYTKYDGKEVLITYISCERSKTFTRIVPVIEGMPAFNSIWQALPDENMFIFPQRSYANYNKMFNKTKNQAGIKRRLWFHLFRHTRFTEWSNRGIPDYVLDYYMGWAAGSMQHNTYRHLTNSQLELQFILPQIDYINKYGVNSSNI